MEENDSKEMNEDVTDAKLDRNHMRRRKVAKALKEAEKLMRNVTTKNAEILDFDNLEYYPMNGKRLAIIFSHYIYQPKLNLTPRFIGNDRDEENLKKAFKSKNFEVKMCTDYKYDEIMDVLRNVGNVEDLCCLVIVIMTHGQPGKISAYDAIYPISHVWEKFLGNFPGIPKLFFIQACRGNKADGGVKWQPDGPNQSSEKIDINTDVPLMSDFLLMYSTYDGYISFRNVCGSWFIKELSEVLLEDADNKMELMHLLTAINRKIAIDYQTGFSKKALTDQKKQMPQIVSMLRKAIKF